MNFEDNLKKNNIILPEAASPVGSYVATKISNDLLFFITGKLLVAFLQPVWKNSLFHLSLALHCQLAHQNVLEKEKQGTQEVTFYVDVLCASI